MAAHAAIFPSVDYTDIRPMAHASRGHDAYTRDYDLHDDHDMEWEPQVYGQHESTRHDSAPAYHAYYSNALVNHRYRENSIDTHAPIFREDEHYQPGKPEFPPGNEDRDAHRKDYDGLFINRKYHGLYRRGGRASHDTDPDPRYHELQQSGRRDQGNAHRGSARARADIPFYASPSHSQTQHSRPWRPSRSPNSADSYAQTGNPNAMPIGKRGAQTNDETHLSVRGKSYSQPPYTAAGYASEAPKTRNDSYKETNQCTISQQNDASATEPMPLSDLSPHIHPSRHAVMSGQLPTVGLRQIANMRAPRKQLDPETQSMERKQSVPAFLADASNANAMPLGPTRF